MKTLTFILAVLLQTMPFLNQLQKRDSILIADQLEYGITLTGVTDTVMYGWPAPKTPEFMPEVYTVKGWQVDTLDRKDGRYSLRGSFVIQPFAEGYYELPPIILMRRHPNGQVDTLAFEGLPMEVTTIQIDTATFVPHDIRPQIKYPVTFKEVVPWVLLCLGIIALIALAVWLIIRFSRRKSAAAAPKEPAHITALRKLDHYRSNKFWVPEKQKQFYSGVTDALREYIAARYGIGALEMTSAELFSDLKDTDIPAGLYTELKEMFERSDFVKFAKYVASDEENAGVLPLSVRFVSETYIHEEEEKKEE